MWLEKWESPPDSESTVVTEMAVLASILVTKFIFFPEKG